MPRSSTSVRRCCWRGCARFPPADRAARPSVDRLVRLVGWARERAHERTFERLAPQLTDQVRAKLDGLLVTEGGRCGHAWLRARPTSVSARALGREFEKRAFLIGELGADRFDLDGAAAEPAGVAGADRAPADQSGALPDGTRAALSGADGVLRRGARSARPTTRSRSTTARSAAPTGRRSANARSSSAAPAATPRRRSAGSSTSPASCWKRTIPAAMSCG